MITIITYFTSKVECRPNSPSLVTASPDHYTEVQSAIIERFYRGVDTALCLAVFTELGKLADHELEARFRAR